MNLPENRGKAEAVRAGLQQALASDAGLVAYWDADLATPLFLIEDFLRIADRQSEIEVVFGSRRKMLGHRVERTVMRSMVSRICASLARLAIGLPIADTQCGAKMFRATPALKESVSVPFTAGWLFDVELLFLYPWAVAQGHADGFERVSAEIPNFQPGLVFVEIMVFVALLAVGFAYAWKKGVFQWR